MTLLSNGAVAEWFKAAVLKTVVRRRTGGSNPPCSVLKRNKNFWFLFLFRTRVFSNSTITRLVLWNFVFPTAQFFCGFSTKFFLTLIFWSDDREAEGGSLLRSYTPKGYRGFESPLLRSFLRIKTMFLFLKKNLSFCFAKTQRYVNFVD